MKVVIYNDTTNAFGLTHFGCQLVMESLHDMLSGFDVIGTVPLDDARRVRWPTALLSEADLIIANGEGSFHHNRRPDFIKLAQEYPTALINTVYDSNTYTKSELSQFQYIAVRETASAAALQKQDIDCDVVPDVIFSSKYLEHVQVRSGGGVITVDHFKGLRTLQDKSKVVPIIAAADAVHTGSFHAACVAMYYGKPVSLWASNTHKMEGLARDADIPCDSIERDGAAFKKARSSYVLTTQACINGMIDNLHNLKT